jgi:three-Cys-motif partner protein
MAKRTTRTGQQYSEATPHKLKAFRYLVGFHAGVCEKIIKKYHQPQPYIYIDLNCGAGLQLEYREFGNEILGSPIIALEELNKKGIEPICHFCDENQEALESLKKVIQDMTLKCEAHYWHGDNKKSLLDISKELGQSSLGQSSLQGLIYSDPNGKQDFPLTEIQKITRLPQMKKVDILMNVATTYVKRWQSNPKANWETHSLEDIVSNHGKTLTFIRQPEDEDRNLKWTFIYATNWGEQKNLKKIRLYNINDEVGKEILDHIFNPRFTALPIDKDGGISIQQTLDFSDDSNTEVDS